MSAGFGIRAEQVEHTATLKPVGSFRLREWPTTLRLAVRVRSVKVAVARDNSNSPEHLARRLCSEEFARQSQEESTTQVSGVMPGSLRRATLV